MKKIIILIAAISLGIYGTAYAHDNDMSRDNATRMERNKRVSAEDSLAFEQACQMLKDQTFVFEINRIIFDRGQNVMVTANTNFIMLNNDRGTVQIAPMSTGGPNGVGGITLDGTPSAIDYRTDKKGTFYMSFNIVGANITAAVNITLPYGSTTPNVRISSMYNSTDLNLFGTLVSPANSTVFQGITY